MLDFGALPPEVNSARMYAGPGSGPIIAAASAWQAIASQLDSVARGYTAVISGLQDEAWTGGASAAMAEAVQPYVEWMASGAAQAEETAGQARAAAAAYESAYAATVPPALIAANRAECAALVATNILGQNTTQIAATEAVYAQMWAQDAATMYGYAASSSAASRLTPFSEPPQTTTSGATSAQAAAVAQAVDSSTASSSQSTLSQLLTALPQHIQSLAAAGASTGPFSSPLLNAVFDLNQFLIPPIGAAAFTRTFFSGGSFKLAADRAAEENAPKIGDGGPGALAGQAEPAVPHVVREPVLVDVARAEKIGGLSVPQTWASATPIGSAFEEPEWMSNTDLEAVPASADSGPSAGAGPMVGMSSGANTRSSISNSLRVPPRRFTMPRPPQGG